MRKKETVCTQREKIVLAVVYFQIAFAFEGREFGKMLCNVATCQENYHLSPALILVVQNINRTKKSDIPCNKRLNKLFALCVRISESQEDRTGSWYLSVC